MLSKLEAAIGYNYKDKKLLQMALSHSSYANENYKDNLHSYERLEFLGDSILGFVAADFLYRSFPEKHEGELTRLRAEMVCEKNLAAIAEEILLGDYILLGIGEQNGGGRHRSGILCDVMESLLAAAYLDGGFDAVRGIIKRLVLQKMSHAARSNDYKTELQELVQRRKDQVLQYELVGESGPDHCKEFVMQVLLNGRVVGHGSGSSKKRAEQAAAAEAISTLFPDKK